MLVLSRARDFQKMVMWTKHFLRSLTQVPTPTIYALWPDSVNLIHARSLWKQFRGMFSCEQKRTEGVLFGFIDASSARYHTRGWETLTVLSSSNLLPLFQSSLKLQPVLGEVWYLWFTYNFHELKLIGRNSIQTGFFHSKTLSPLWGRTLSYMWWSKMSTAKRSYRPQHTVSKTKEVFIAHNCSYLKST